MDARLVTEVESLGEYYSVSLRGLTEYGNWATLYPGNPKEFAQDLRKVANLLDPPPVPNEGAVSKEIISDIDEQLLIMGEGA